MRKLSWLTSDNRRVKSSTHFINGFLESVTADPIQNCSLNHLGALEYRLKDIPFELKPDIDKNFIDLFLWSHNVKILLSDPKRSKLFREQQLNCGSFICIVLNKWQSTLGSATLCISGFFISYRIVGTPKHRFSSPSFGMFLLPIFVHLPKSSSCRTSYSVP